MSDERWWVRVVIETHPKDGDVDAEYVAETNEEAAVFVAESKSAAVADYLEDLADDIRSGRVGLMRSDPDGRGLAVVR